MTIKTWRERDAYVHHGSVVDAMQSEIDDYKAVLAATQQRMAGFDVKRCVCVFDDKDNLVRECDHHKTAVATARASERGRCAEWLTKKGYDQFATEIRALNEPAQGEG